MSVTTITITVGDATAEPTVTGDAAMISAGLAELGESGAGEAPAPTLLGGTGDYTAVQAAETGEGPPPLEPEALGVAGVGGQSDIAAPPPDDLVEASESDDTEANEPMPIEDLEKSAKPARSPKST